MSTATPINIILSGAPGKMCRAIASLAGGPEYAGRFALAPFALSSKAHVGERTELAPGYKPECHAPKDLPRLLDTHGLHGAIVIDYTGPEAALDNVRCYVGGDVSFVMGTTGFDRDEAVRLMRGTPGNAVIAPNMAAPIVLLQTLLAEAAARFPNALAGYELMIRESHQSTKKDVSGTARAFQPLLEKVGARLSGSIESIRDVETQRAMGVPEGHLAGHGWHWYDAVSPAGDVALGFSHCVNGRRVYAEGTLLAVEFLARRIATGAHGEIYTMQDVLKG